jgi:hypothetical protein
MVAHPVSLSVYFCIGFLSRTTDSFVLFILPSFDTRFIAVLIEESCRSIRGLVDLFASGTPLVLSE